MRRKSLGFLLSGPLGLAVASSEVIPCVEEHGMRALVAVGKTPGLMDDYQSLIKKKLLGLGIHPASEAETVSQSSTLVCVGWRSLVNEEEGVKDVFVVHDSLLPQLRGWNPLVTAVQLGLETTGVTLFRAEKKPDTGPIVMQQSFRLGAGVKISNAIERAGKSLVELLIGFVEALSTGTISETPQNELEATMSPWRSDGDYVVDWSRSSFETQQFILSRGFPYQGARTSVDGTPIKIGAAKVSKDLPELAISSPGKICALNDGKPVVACGSGFVEISELCHTNGDPFTPTQFRTQFGT